MRKWGGGFCDSALESSDPAEAQKSSNSDKNSNPYTTEYYADAEKAADVSSITIPATVQSIDVAFFQLFPNAANIEVAADNPNYQSYNGIVFSADLSSLTLVPEGIEGTAVLPAELTNVPACVFSRCTKLSVITVQNGGTATSSAYVSSGGILYTADKTTLVAAPAGIGASVVIDEECTAIAQGAFVGNKDLSTIIVKGNVANIATEDETHLGAFDAQVVSGATVVLSANSDRSVWEKAGFVNFEEPVSVGDSVTPDADGLAFTVLPNYTLSCYWAGDKAHVPSTLVIPDYGIIKGVPYNISAIEDEAFEGASNLQAVQLPKTIDSIGKRAFANCENLSYVELNASINTLPAGVFANTSLASVVLPASIELIESKAFAGINNTTIVQLGAIENIAEDALEGASNVDVYAPYNSQTETYMWNTSLPIQNNHVIPYGIKFADGIDSLQTGDEVELFGAGGYLYATGKVKANISYDAKCISIDTKNNTLSAKRDGAFTVNVDLSITVPEVLPTGTEYKNVKLTPASYGGQAFSAPAQTSTIHRSVRALNETLRGSVSTPKVAAEDMLSITVPIYVTFGGDEGIDVSKESNLAQPITTETFIRSNGAACTLESLTCVEAEAGSAQKVLKTNAGTLDAQSDLFSILGNGDASFVDFGYGSTNNTLDSTALTSIQDTFTLAASSAALPTEQKFSYRLNLSSGGASIKTRSELESSLGTIDKTKTHPLVLLTFTFKKADTNTN
ncbi:leucine-rich repeat domain-containing protein [Adlercreutzia sp. ZJ154]|uniref:leucine-rich repeat domain-containing protein n=1 Tax=Adlercreutzia sp. ZJ154 TaxID=2709790 RepID=UPI0013EE0109|nr:leucine-rich repeat domain-containing protein [Adlercreutzia sp. ZJ154]